MDHQTELQEVRVMPAHLVNCVQKVLKENVSNSIYRVIQLKLIVTFIVYSVLGVVKSVLGTCTDERLQENG